MQEKIAQMQKEKEMLKAKYAQANKEKKEKEKLEKKEPKEP